MFRSPGATAFVAAALSLTLPILVPVLVPVSAFAQNSGSGWFVPKNSAPSDDSSAHRRPMPPPPQPTDIGDQGGDQGGDPNAAGQAPQTPPVLPLPPIPALGTVPKGTPPQAAVIGVLSVQDVMRQSIAAQQVERVLGARRDKLNQDAQREQAAWRDMQQQIQSGKGSQEQMQTREHALQQRVAQAQKDFRNRNRILQESAQVALGQVERELVQVIRQVSAARGMNLVLHREQVALNINDFDITAQVINQLNATLTAVFIPGDGVDPEALAKSGAFPTTANPGPQPAAAAVDQASASAPAAAAPVKH